jgi:flagellar assembly protein FliH
MADAQSSPLEPTDVVALIDHLLKTKDPAVVGLRRILRHKEQEGAAYPIHSAGFEELSIPGKDKTVFTEDERHVLELEKQNKQLTASIEAQKQKTEIDVKAAFEKGLAEGHKKGEETGHKKAADDYNKKIAEIQARVNAFLKKLEEDKIGIFSNSDRICVRLACEFAKKVLHKELSTNADAILPVVKRALSLVAEKERIVIRVAKDDFETVSGKKDFWAPVTERLVNVAIELDDKIERGGCIIESNSGMVDARLGVQLADLCALVEKTWEAVDSTQKQQAGL